MASVEKISKKDIETAMIGLSKLQETNFKEMNKISREFRWSTFYFSGGNEEDCNKVPLIKHYLLNDPRKYGYDNEDWNKFSYQHESHRRLVYSYNHNWYSTSFKSIQDFITNHLDMGSKVSFKTESDKNRYSCMLGGIAYFSKLDSFKEYLSTVARFSESLINYLCKLPINGVVNGVDINHFNESVNELTMYTGIEPSKLRDNHLGMYCKEASYLDPSRIDLYKSIRDDYNKQMHELLDVIKSSPGLNMCLQSSIQGDTYGGDMMNSNIDIDVNQAMSCMGDVINNINKVSNESSLDTCKSDINELHNEIQKYNDELKKLMNHVYLSTVVIVIMIIGMLLLTWFITDTRRRTLK